jgi:hypothetical protein
MFNDLMHCRLHEPQTREKRTQTPKMTHTNMRTVVVIKQVQHDQDQETTIIIFEEDIHDLQKKNQFSTSEKLDLDLNDSSTTTNMEPAPPIKDPSIKDTTYQIIEPHLNEQTRIETMSRFSLRYNVQDYCRKYPDDPGNQIINDGNVVRPGDLKWAGRNEQHEWVRDNDNKHGSSTTDQGP